MNRSVYSGSIFSREIFFCFFPFYKRISNFKTELLSSGLGFSILLSLPESPFVVFKDCTKPSDLIPSYLRLHAETTLEIHLGRKKHLTVFEQ